MSTLIDIILFPLNKTGIAHIVLFTVLLFAMQFIRFFVSQLIGPFARYTMIAFGLLSILVGIEIIQYLYLCTQESTQGALRAPDNMFNDSFKFGSWSDLLEEFAYHISPYIICFMPAILYQAFKNQTDIIFFVLLTAGTIYFPMSFLAIAMFNSPMAFNPFIHILSVLKTFFSYCLLVIQCIIVVILFLISGQFLQNQWLTSVLACPILLYFMIIIAHLIGRYYCHNEVKLNWEV